MPIYEYQAAQADRSCAHCVKPFEVLQKLSDPPLTACPRCGAALTKLVSPPAIGSSRSGWDAKARDAGFHKLKRLGKGEYERKY
jgi:putative FmdB family regulatory protein